MYTPWITGSDSGDRTADPLIERLTADPQSPPPLNTALWVLKRTLHHRRRPQAIPNLDRESNRKGYDDFKVPLRNVFIFQRKALFFQ